MTAGSDSHARWPKYDFQFVFNHRNIYLTEMFAFREFVKRRLLSENFRKKLYLSKTTIWAK